MYLLGRVGTTLLPQGKQYTFEADVRSSIALANAADVREAGVEIGRVTGIKQAGSITALELSIGSKYGPVYRDGTILIRAKSVAGENYVELDPGRSPHRDGPRGRRAAPEPGAAAGTGRRRLLDLRHDHSARACATGFAGWRRAWRVTAAISSTRRSAR